MAKTRKGSAAVKKMEDTKPQKVRLILRDRETGETRLCTLDEAKTWDWENPEIWRMETSAKREEFRFAEVPPWLSLALWSRGER